MAAHFHIVTLKFWHGGKFKNNNNGELRYLGGKSRTFKVDPDELCYWEMLEFANKCGYIAVAGVFYLVPGMKLQDGLRRIEGDTEVLEMGELLIKSRCLEVYLMHSDDYGAPLRNRHAVVGHPPVQNVPQTEEVPHVEVAPVEAVPLSQVPPSSEVQPEENPPLTDDQPVGISRQAPKPKTKTVRKKLTPKKGPHPTKVVEGLNTSPRKQQESSTSAKPDFITPSTKPTKKLSSIYQQSHPSLTDPTTTFKPLNPDLRLKGNVKTSEEQADPLLATTNLPPIDLAFDTDYEWEDNRPESPLKWSELVGDVGDFSEESDPEYEPEYEKACEGDDEDDCDLSDIEIQELEFLSHEEPVVGGESDESDGELAEARERVKTVNSRLFEIAQNLQQEALDGKLAQAILHVAEVLPKAEHRHCARHIFSLWHRTYKGDEMKLLFWKIAKAYNEADFNDAWDELNELNPEAALAFKRYNPTCFCRAFLDTTIKTDAITNNMAKTFNAYIINARTKHLIYMLEDVRVGLMQRLVKKKIELGKCTTVLCPRIQARLDKEKEHAANCDVLPSSDTLFNVRYYLDQLNVDLVERSCSCRKWNMCGIPCCHAVACIFFLNKAAEDYVDDCYKLETYFKAYGGSIPPCEGERYWPRVPCNLDPPPIKIGPGRPRKNRIKHPSENPKKPGSLSRSGIEMTCTICKTKGHNKRRCPDKGKYSAPEPAPKRARGRPRNDGGQPESQPIIPSQMASSSTPAVTPTPAATPISAQHHTTSAQPSRLGRSGRVIAGGQGARGASQSAARGRQATASGTPITRGRGRAKDVVGVGVLFNADGTPQSQPITTRARASGHGRGRGTKSSFT